MPETVEPPAAAITEAPPAAPPGNERPVAGQARPEPAEGDAWEDREGGAEVLKEVLPQALLSDAVAVRAPNSVVEGRNW
jgi:hypothetical protein